MANFTKSFREEVVRLTRRAVRAELKQLKRASSQHRRDVAALKRQNVQLARKVASLEKRTIRGGGETVEDAPPAKTIRYSAAWLTKHRQKLGFSAAEYGKLIDVSAQSIYMWEQGKTKPRAAQLEKLASVRGLGRREALARLTPAGKKK